MEKFKVVFYPGKEHIEVAKDTTILSAAVSCGVQINSVCGGDGVCGKCKVIVKKGKVLTQPNGAVSLEEKRKNIYLACLTTIHSDAEIEVPLRSRQDFAELSTAEIDARLKGFFVKPEEVAEAGRILEKEAFLYLPLARKYYLELPPPTLEDNISDLDRLFREIAKIDRRIYLNLEAGINIHTGLVNIKQLAELLRDAEWKITVTLGDRDGITEVLGIESGDTSHSNFGVCFDIGTTTISGQLVDLNSQKVIATKATYNQQAHFGSDVITRIIYAETQNGLEKLHHTVTATLNEMIREFSQEHRLDLNHLNYVLCAGNTTMMHLLLSIDPTYIRRQPYIPTANFIPTIRAIEADIHIGPRGFLACVPGISSYVGGDTTAGVLSSGLYKENEICLLIDIGTNGEIVLGNKDFLVACAASAGPAFEGSGVSCGMRASKGAIQKVEIEKDTWQLKYETIEQGKPRGICGSGYIDLLAKFLRTGIIERDGKFKIKDKKRLRQTEFGTELILIFRKDTEIGSDIVITEADIENLKRSKAAIYSAAAILARRMELDFSAIRKIFIAGGFGTYLNVESAITIGLLPDLPREKFIFIGNSSLAGAREALLSAEALRKTSEIARKMTYFELSTEPTYMDEYSAALFFPHTDLSKFPSIRG